LSTNRRSITYAASLWYGPGSVTHRAHAKLPNPWPSPDAYETKTWMAYVVLSIFPFRFDLEATNYPRAALLEGFKTPRLASDAPFTSLRELSDFNDEHTDPTRFVQTRRSSPCKTT
jgi:hypothetical protein